MQQLHGVEIVFLTFWTQLKNNEHFNTFGQIVDYEIVLGAQVWGVDGTCWCMANL